MIQNGMQLRPHLLVKSVREREYHNNQTRTPYEPYYSHHVTHTKEEHVNLDGLRESCGRKVATKRLEQVGETGAWLSVIPNRFDGTELSREEFQDNLAIRYGLRPRGLPEQCDGCNNPLRWHMG